MDELGAAGVVFSVLLWVYREVVVSVYVYDMSDHKTGAGEDS